MSFIKKTGDWNRARSVMTGLGERWLKAREQATKQEALFMERRLKEGLRNQAPGDKAFQPLSKMTLLGRRQAGFKGSKALLRSGTLLRSIGTTSFPTSSGTTGYLVGILRSARGPNGESLIDIAEVHENGAGPFVIQMTPAMRRRLFVMLKGQPKDPARAPSASPGYVIVRIPARPIFGPTLAKWGKPSDVKARFYDRIDRIMAGLSPGSYGPQRVSGKKKSSGPPERDPTTGRFLKAGSGGGGGIFQKIGKWFGGGSGGGKATVSMKGRDPKTGRFLPKGD